MMAQDRTESIVEPINHERFINQFPPDTIKSMRELEKINPKMCRQRMSLLFNQVYINEEMLPKHTHTHTHIHTRACIYMCVCEGGVCNEGDILHRSRDSVFKKFSYTFFQNKERWRFNYLCSRVAHNRRTNQNIYFAKGERLVDHCTVIR